MKVYTATTQYIFATLQNVTGTGTGINQIAAADIILY